MTTLIRMLILVFWRQSFAQVPTVTTPRGIVSGFQVRTPMGTLMDAFLGIPYGDKPVRFQKSVLRTPWTGLYNASNFGPGCPRPATPTAPDPGNEDCLFMKIIRPRGVSASAGLPVLYWPHGGGYSAGKNSDYDYIFQGDNYIFNDVILAQPNNRVGVLGFWSTATSEAPGNWGMWDVLLGLQWLKENIASFGGDPNHIVLAGQGAGGITTSMMALSPQTRPGGVPMFKGAMMLSGTMFTTQVNIPDSINQQRYAQFAADVGCDTADNQLWNSGRRGEILNCIKIADLTRILAAQNTGTLYWHPRMDGPGGIWPTTLVQLAQARPNFPMMVGTTFDETSWDIMVGSSLFGNPQFQINRTSLNQPTRARQECANRVNGSGVQNTNLVIASCQFYFVDRILQNNLPQTNPRSQYFWIFQAVELGSAFTYHAPLVQELSYALQNGNQQIYLLSFDYIRQQNNWWKTVNSFHNMDLSFIENFFADNYKTAFSFRDWLVRSFYSTAIPNFAKNLNPVPGRWLPYDASGRHYSIDFFPAMKTGFHQESVNFWNQIVAPLING